MRNKILSQAAGTAFKNQQNQPSFETGEVKMYCDILGSVWVIHVMLTAADSREYCYCINCNNLLFHVNHAYHCYHHQGSWVGELRFYFSNNQEYVRTYYILCNHCRLN